MTSHTCRLHPIFLLCFGAPRFSATLFHRHRRSQAFELASSTPSLLSLLLLRLLPSGGYRGGDDNRRRDLHTFRTGAEPLLEAPVSRRDHRTTACCVLGGLGHICTAIRS